MQRVLVADDEAALRKVVRDALERADLDVETVSDGEEALERFEGSDFALVVTDLAMPRRDGLALVRELRRRGATVPILVLTVRGEEQEKVRLLDAGADDYVTKPFGVAELVARAKALIRRRDGSQAPGGSRFGDVEVDTGKRTVRKAGRAVHLTPIEYLLLQALLRRPGGVWTHRQHLAEVWGAISVSNDTVRVHMGSLRRKLESDPNRPKWIRTEPWVGYRFTPD